MAALFVTVPFPPYWTGGCRSWTRTPSPINCEPTSPESLSWVRGVGTGVAAVGAQTSDDTLSSGEGAVRDSWVMRPVTPTLLGYEILEEREKFTVYKILVTGGEGNSWLIFRRYTDFCRLSDKLKELFPSSGLALPAKRWFKDNYDEEFLDQRQIGLQTFLQNLASHKDIIDSVAVKRFLCLDEPPGPFDSLEESRAFCETLEETNHHLQRELLENQREIDALRKTLEEKENRVSLLVKKAQTMSLSSESFEGSCQLTASTSRHTQRGGDAEHTDGNERLDDNRGNSITKIRSSSGLLERSAHQYFLRCIRRPTEKQKETETENTDDIFYF